jgi:exonuclease SbcC
MAGELAGAMAVGDDCPVCGSADHPRPARVVTGHPDVAAERAASRAVVDAQALEHAVAERLRELDDAVTSARAVVGVMDDAESDRVRDDARTAYDALREGSVRHAEHVVRLEAARGRAVGLRHDSEIRRARRRELTAALRDLTAEVERLATAVDQARGSHVGLDAAVVELEARRDLLRRAHADTSRRDAAVAALDDAELALARAASDAGFDDAAGARAAELPADQLAALELRVRERLSALEAARGVLDEPGAGELLAMADPDVPAREEDRRLAEQAVEQLRAAAEHAVRTHSRVHRLDAELTAALATWAPVRDELALATAVSSFADGKAADNRLQMRLSAYVLAHRLSQVVAAANARLAQMSDRRYTLEHVAQRGAGERRGGLSLVVRDDWSGESRDPATLSGGESFVVSLALALGLADVVAHEAGGADLQTLFVDEGFGALDAETLDDVLDILDTLRENGRAVGVVSHVAEMRDRIPTQLVVDKARSGSTVRVVG